MARIEGTGIKEPSKEAKVASLKFLRNPKKFLQEKVDQKLDSMTKSGKTPFGTSIGGSAVGEEGLGRFGNPNDLSDASETFERRDFFSMKTDPRNEVKVASADGVQSLSLPGSDEFKQEVKQYEQSIRDSDIPGHIDKFGTDELKNLTEQGQKNLEDSYKIYRDFNYERNPIKYVPGIDFSKKEEKPSFLQRASNLAGSIFNAATGTQTAAAGEMPSGTQFSPSGDTSFASYRMAGGEQKQQGSGIVTPFSQTSMGKGEPRSITKFKDTSMGRKPVANLPSDYKQTEAREFAKAAAFQQAKKNPNVTVGVDSKGQPTATAVQRGRGESGGDNTAQGNQARVQQNAKARAQAAAFNRRMSGKSISQVKAANRQSMRDSAAERQKAFKKTGKSTVGARRAAAKKRVQAAAKKRNAAFKKRRAESKARKAARNAARKRARSRRRGRRGRGR